MWNLLGGFKLLGGSLGGLARQSDGFSDCGYFWGGFRDSVDSGARELEWYRGSLGAEGTN